MAANREDVDNWIKTAIKEGHQFIISVCDTWDYDDYPVYCKDKEELTDKHVDYDGVNMQKINEIIQIVDGKAIENLSMQTII